MANDMNDIYSALMDARRAAESLMTWQRGADGRDSVRGMQGSIERGIKAYEALSRDLRDGRKHVDEPPPHAERRPVAANLTKADDGCELCETCGGEGVTMIGVLLPTGHSEQDVECPDCGGEGQIELRAATTTNEEG